MTMRATLTSSALNAAYKASPADFDLLRAANTAKARPAIIPIEPPSAAEIAPCSPASQADNRVTAAVHKNCSPIIGRNTCHTLHPAAKPPNFKGKPTAPSNWCDAKSLDFQRDRSKSASSYRVEQRVGRNVRIEHAQFFPEVEAPSGDRDAVVVGARNEVLAALLGEGTQDLEVRLHAQLLVGGGLDAEVRDEVPLRVRLVVLGLADRDDPRSEERRVGKSVDL